MRRLWMGMTLAAMIGLAPAASFGSDREMAQRIADELRESGALIDYNIGVKFQDGTAWLSGRVRDQEQLEAAVNIVGAMEDVENVINDVEIKPSRQPAPIKKTTNRKTKSTKQPIARTTSAEEDEPLPISEPDAKPRTATRKRTGKPTSYQAEGESAPTATAPAPAPGSFVPADAREVPGEYYGGGSTGAPLPAYMPGAGGGAAPVSYDQPHMPDYAWPSYAAYPNYAALTYPRQYSPTAWPYIGPFYPYPQVPLGWRKVTLEWDDGWWFLDFDDCNQQHSRRW